mmetsp:Transcript_108916/g.232725  ORF Transcript_108916/g.232725 Transcript_108916/m.232725 type:complete len:365 (-) Transcript_108916:545-1639(-)
MATISAHMALLCEGKRRGVALPGAVAPAQGGDRRPEALPKAEERREERSHEEDDTTHSAEALEARNFLLDNELFLHGPHQLTAPLTAIWHGDIARRRLCGDRSVCSVDLHVLDGHSSFANLSTNGLYLVHGRRLRRPHFVGVRAFAWVNMVHPLRKEAAVQRNLTTVVAGDLLEKADQTLGESPGGGDRGGGKALGNGDEALRRGFGSGDLAFDLAEEGLALIEAADGVHARRCQAIGGSVDIVRNDHALLRGIGLVESAKLPQILDTLGELPSAIQALPVEVRQLHATSACILELYQRPLEVLAFLILPLAIAFSDLLDDLRSRIEGNHVLRGGGGAHSSDIPHHLAREVATLFPIRVGTPDL